jgi:hypothetical protein
VSSVFEIDFEFGTTSRPHIGNERRFAFSAFIKRDEACQRALKFEASGERRQL